MMTVAEENEVLKRHNTLLNDELTKIVKACAFMHDDKTLNIPMGGRVTVEGVIALRDQRNWQRGRIAELEKDNETFRTRIAELEAKLEQERSELKHYLQ